MYFPLMAAVPAIAALVVSALERGQCDQGDRAATVAAAAAAPRATAARAWVEWGSVWGGSVLALLVIVLWAEAAVARSLLPAWQNTTSFFEASLRADPSDWRMLETFAEHKHYIGDVAGAVPLLERALLHLPPPESGVKALLDRGGDCHVTATSPPESAIKALLDRGGDCCCEICVADNRLVL